MISSEVSSHLAAFVRGSCRPGGWPHSTPWKMLQPNSAFRKNEHFPQDFPTDRCFVSLQEPQRNQRPLVKGNSIFHLLIIRHSFQWPWQPKRLLPSRANVEHPLPHQHVRLCECRWAVEVVPWIVSWLWVGEFRVRLPGFKYWPCHCLAVWPRTSSKFAYLQKWAATIFS